jgi:hypothetical protein
VNSPSLKSIKSVILHLLYARALGFFQLKRTKQEQQRDERGCRKQDAKSRTLWTSRTGATGDGMSLLSGRSCGGACCRWFSAKQSEWGTKVKQHHFFKTVTGGYVNANRVVSISSPHLIDDEVVRTLRNRDNFPFAEIARDEISRVTVALTPASGDWQLLTATEATGGWELLSVAPVVAWAAAVDGEVYPVAANDLGRRAYGPIALRRADAPAVYTRNGCIFADASAWLRAMAGDA